MFDDRDFNLSCFLGPGRDEKEGSQGTQVIVLLASAVPRWVFFFFFFFFFFFNIQELANTRIVELVYT